MAKYKVGDKVVLVRGLSDMPSQFYEGPVIVAGICDEGTVNEHYTIHTKNDERDLSWVSDDEIDHEATELLRK